MSAVEDLTQPRGGLANERKNALQPIPAFTVPDQLPISNADELVDFESAEVPGSQITLRSHNLTHTDDCSGYEEDVYEQQPKRQKIVSCDDTLLREDPSRSATQEDASIDSGVLESAVIAEEESNDVASQSIQLDTFSLEMMMEGAAEFPASIPPIGKELSSTQYSEGFNVAQTASVTPYNSADVLQSDDGVTASLTTLIDSSVHSWFSSTQSSDASRSVSSCGAVNDYIASNMSPVAVDDIADLIELEGSERSLTNSLLASDSFHLSSQLNDDEGSHGDELEQVSNSLQADLSFDDLSGHTSKSDQQVPLSSEDEIESNLRDRSYRRRQLQSCSAQLVPERDIEE